MHSADVIVVGGGSFGAAVAYGLVRQGVETIILDGADDSLRAARGNFGLVGGAQAVALLAYGGADTDGGELAPVDMITGPGNIYVTAAKRICRSQVGIDADKPLIIHSRKRERRCFEILEEMGIPFVEQDIQTYDVVNADEAWMPTTPYCLGPVVRFNGVPVGDGTPGPLWRKIIDRWSEAVDKDIYREVTEAPEPS